MTGEAHRLSAGLPYPLGVTPDAEGVNVAVFSAHASAILVCLFDDQDRETARIALPERSGDIFHGHLAGIRPGQRYGLRAIGPFLPKEGHRFNAHKLLLDPHAAAIDRPFVLHPAMFGYRLGDPDADLSFDDVDSAPFMPKAVVTKAVVTKAVVTEASGCLSSRPITPWNRTILYELHVRGFTKLHPEVPEALRGTFAGLAQPEPLRHLVELGISSVEMLPVAAWLDERHLGPLGLSNYWGYNPVAFGAPDPRLAPGGWDEIRATIATLEASGLETILDVVLNHSGEGDHLGPTVSLRGLDNASYYRLDAANPRFFVNDAGCGNILALERPAIIRFAMDNLRRFAEWGGVHGFRFDLATTMGRRAEGFDAAHPLLTAIAQDPVLSRLKLIAEPWDIGPGGYRLGEFPAEWGEWNDQFRDVARRFWRGDAGMLGAMATRFAGSADLFAGRRRPLSRSINYITAHDGFTLADLVSHEHKHNAENGEENRDGTDANHSWNHGQEGESHDREILSRRARDQRALLATLLLARGTPMLAMGDEIGRSQNGNNNAYAQDNAVSWLDWQKADHALLEHTRRLIAARNAHPALRQDRPLTGAPIDASGIPDVVWLRADAQPMREGDWNDPANRLMIGVFYAGADEEPGRVLVGLNSGLEAREIVLPEPGDGLAWYDAESRNGLAETFTLPARAVALLCEHPAAAPRRRAGTEPALLAALAAAAGIAPEWWEVSGRRHVVSPDTHKALLQAMRLPAQTTSQARASLMRLAALRDHRALPLTALAQEGVPSRLDLPPASAQRMVLHIQGEDGQLTKVEIAPQAGEIVRKIGCDGRPVLRRRVRLPPLPPGRFSVMLAHAPETICTLIVAPERCWQPKQLEERPFGIAAHLYTLRREGDQGIGDFTTLGQFGSKAAGAGAAILGLNPLHALFSQDRTRASPYFPSDRRFLDPIYIDVASGPFAEAEPVRAVLAQHESLFERLSSAGMVDYPVIWQAKRAVLASAFEVLEAAGNGMLQAERADFSAFLEEGGEELARFAAFEAIGEGQHGTPWRQWPEGLHAADPGAIAKAAKAHGRGMRLAQFEQWMADRALARAAKEAGLSLGFYRDLAVGAAPDGAEAWACQDVLANGVSIGAPPDPFAAEGQIWHLPAPDPLGVRQDGYKRFAHLLAANMRHAGALRIDHAMGLSRLFWVPDGASAREGAYVAYPFSEQLGVLALESQRARCIIVGEDLGTVPEGFREAMDRMGVLSYRALWLERDGPAFRQPRDYPVSAAACISTHDLPTLAGWWLETDIDEQETLGFISAEAALALRSERLSEKSMLAQAMAAAGLPIDPDGKLDISLAARIHQFLASAPSIVKLVQADDLAGEITRLNLPGTDRERPNWRRKLSPKIDQFLNSPLPDAILRAIRR